MQLKGHGLLHSGSCGQEIGVKELKQLGAIALIACLMFSSMVFSFVTASPITPSSLTVSSNTSGLYALQAQQYDMSIPSKYQGEYSSLETILNQFDSSLGSHSVSLNGLTFATELLPANGNRGPDLFRQGNLASVATNLNALQAMGVQGVTIAIGYPLLDPTFPNSAQYVSYFQQVVSMVHAHGMKVLVESQILFCEYSVLSSNIQLGQPTILTICNQSHSPRPTNH